MSIPSDPPPDATEPWRSIFDAPDTDPPRDDPWHSIFETPDADDPWHDIPGMPNDLAAELEAHQRPALEQLAAETDAAWAAWSAGQMDRADVGRDPERPF